MQPFIKVATAQQLASGSSKEVEVDGELIGLFNVDGKIHAASSICPHSGGPLCDGDLEGNMITCPLHGWKFDVTDGKCQNIPGMSIKTYQVKKEGDDIFLSVK